MADQQKSGKHKKYGGKLANPRIGRSKEHRNCGPLGYSIKAREHHRRFTTRAAYFAKKLEAVHGFIYSV